MEIMMKKRTNMKTFLNRHLGKKGYLLLPTILLFLFSYTLTAQATGKIVDNRPDYSIYVNTTKNCITVMEEKADGTSTLAKTMVCSCGKEGHETPEGTFYTSDYYQWRMLVDGSYGKYAVRFNNSILFHSVPYEKPSSDTLKWEQYNLLGQGASLGCVRIASKDAEWIYDNCKVGTKVVVYSGEEIVGNAEIPSSILIDGNSPYRNWDPTDKERNNPWFSEKIALAESIGVQGFDYVAYADRYTDLREVFGYDQVALYKHYINNGVFENREVHFYQ